MTERSEVHEPALLVEPIGHPVDAMVSVPGSKSLTNRALQSQCFLRVVGHLGLIVDGAVYSGVEDALEKQPIRFNCFAL